MAKDQHLFDRILDVTAYIAFGLLLFSWFSVCAEVVFRYFLRQPIIWVVEATEYIIVQITFLGSAWLLRREGHVTVDVVTSHFSKKNRTFILMITSALCVGMFLIITWWGAVATWGAYRENLYIPKQLGMPKFLVMLVIPVGSLLLLGEFLRKTRSAFSRWRSLKMKRNSEDD
jgi:TRAP-type C4-dicarboxylate transport system permease small subunit